MNLLQLYFSFLLPLLHFSPSLCCWILKRDKSLTGSELSAVTSVKLLTIFVASDVSICEPARPADVEPSAPHTHVHPPVTPTSLQYPRPGQNYYYYFERF